jgi:hypothetical protein
MKRFLNLNSSSSSSSSLLSSSSCSENSESDSRFFENRNNQITPLTPMTPQNSMENLVSSEVDKELMILGSTEQKIRFISKYMHLTLIKIGATSESGKHVFTCHSCKKVMAASYAKALFHLSCVGDNNGTRSKACQRPNLEAMRAITREYAKIRNTQESSNKRKQIDLTASFEGSTWEEACQAILLFFVDAGIAPHSVDR